MSSVCNVCHGHVEKKLTSYTQWFEGRLIVVEKVPAWACTQCGETYYDPDVVAHLQSVIWSAQPPNRVNGKPSKSHSPTQGGGFLVME